MRLLLILGATLLTVSASNVTVDGVPEEYLNLSAGNSLWTSLVKNCREPTASCVQNNMYAYLRETLDYPSDLRVAPFMTFTKNHVAYAAPEQSDDDEPDDEPRSAIEEMSRSLRGKGVKFLMTHDLELQLPEAVFHGTTLRLSPRSLEGDGALVKVELLQKSVNAEGRIFKKISKLGGHPCTQIGPCRHSMTGDYRFDCATVTELSLSTSIIRKMRFLTDTLWSPVPRVNDSSAQINSGVASTNEAY
jgi:hypothetical protein